MSTAQTGPTCSLIAMHGIPTVVHQAMDDLDLSDPARLVMWHLRTRLDLLSYTDTYVDSLATEVRRKERIVSRALNELIAEGYLDARGTRPRALRFPWSRRPPRKQAA